MSNVTGGKASKTWELPFDIKIGLEGQGALHAVGAGISGGGMVKLKDGQFKLAAKVGITAFIGGNIGGGLTIDVSKFNYDAFNKSMANIFKL